MISVRLSNFTPSRQGFPFANCFPQCIPVVEVRTPCGPIRFGNAAGGLCGGMVFAAMDFYWHGAMAVPNAAEPSLVRYLCRRLLDSWNLPFGVMKYYDWQRRAGASAFVAGICISRGLTHLTILREWPKIRRELDAGRFAPLGLIFARGFRLTELPRNHQVLCYGYDYKPCQQEATLHIYDPNYPNDDATLTFRMDKPDTEQRIVHSWEGPTVRGLFLTRYRRPCVIPRF